MKQLILVLFLLPLLVFSQNSDKYDHVDAQYFKAEDLFLKQQFGAAREGFYRFLHTEQGQTPSLLLKASYYEAICALELYHDDALRLLLTFLEDYPESKYRHDIYFRVARQYFNRNQFKNSIEWFDKIPAQEITSEEKAEYYFKVGYAHFKLSHFDQAKNAFFQVKDTDSQYATPATYYYAHLAYTNKQYDEALQHFQRIVNESGFDKIVPNYMIQIYHARGENDRVLDLASKMMKADATENQPELNHIIGDAYFKMGDYDLALPHLLAYAKSSNTSREDDYQIGFALSRTNKCDEAMKFFERVTRKQDELAQAAFYHIGECYLQVDDKLSARSAFQQAAKMSYDEQIQEDALFQTAILSYELNINPFDEAIVYFEQYIEKYPTSYRRRTVFEYLVNVYMSTKNYDKAMQSIEKLDPPSTRMKTAYQFLAYNKGIESYTNQDFDEAIASLELVSKYPMDYQLVADSRYWIADSRFQMQQWASAISAFQYFISNSKDASAFLKAEAHYNLGYSLYHAGRRMEAATEFKNYINLATYQSAKKIADAQLRIADCYYVESGIDKALLYESIAFYQRAIDAKQGNEDRALYYQARAYGFTNQGDKQVLALNKLMNEYAKSPYMTKSIFAAGIVRRNQGNYAQSNQFFERILNEFPNNSLVKDALYELGVNHFRLKNYKQAETYLDRLLKDFGRDDKICKYAASQLTEVYKATNSTSKIGQLASRYPCAGITANFQDSIAFDAAYDAYLDSNYQQAVLRFEEYLVAYPNALQKDRANFLMAQSYFNLNDKAKAHGYYKKVIDSYATMYHEIALIRVANYDYDNKNYAEAITNYARLTNIAANPSRKFGAELGLMRCHFLLENWTASLQSAEFVKNSGLAQTAERVEAYFCKGISYRKNNQLDDALPELTFVVKNASNQLAAQAKYTIAEIYYIKGDHAASEKHVRELLKMKPSYDFWNAKALLIQARNFIAKSDLLNAENIVNDIIRNYTNPNDSVLDEALSIQQEIEDLRNQPREIQERNDNFIEIKN